MALFIKSSFFYLLYFLLNGSLLAQGSILLIGGGNDRKVWADDPFRWFVMKADSGKIINIDVDEVATSYASTFIHFGADSSSTSLRIATTTQANDTAVYNQLRSAKGIWIEGGDQYDYVRVWDGTLVEEAMEAVFQNGGVIGGTSAGCAVMGMVDFDAKFGSSHPEDAALNAYHSDIHLSDTFLPFIPNAITDTHFHSRGRLGRLVPMLARRIQDHGEMGITGIGVADNTALCIEADLTAICYGEATVTILYRSDQSDILCESGNPVRFTHIMFDQLIHGSRYDLQKHALLEAGPGLNPVLEIPDPPDFKNSSLSGSHSGVADSGEVVITGITDGDLAAWYGNLGQRPGNGTVPHAVLMTQLWENTDFFENRWVGGMYGIAAHPGFIAYYLDTVSEISISASNYLHVKGLAYLLDSRTATFIGFPSGKQTNYPGMIGATLHFLSDGDSLRLINEQSAIQNQKQSFIPRQIILHPNYPNPFNSTTHFQYQLGCSGMTRLDVLNMKGELVENLVNRYHRMGSYETYWCPEHIASGVFLLRLCQKESMAVQKLCFLK